MSAHERRLIKATFLAGVTVIALGLFVVFMGWSEWWYNKTHLLGSFGIEMLVLAFYMWILYPRDV